MLLLTAFSKFNRWVGPYMVDKALRVRSALGATTTSASGSLPAFLDALLLHPFAKLISIEAHHQYMDDDQVKQLMTAGDLKGASERRVHILETQYVGPKDVLARHWDAYRTHERLQKWLRSEYLLARHGPKVQASFRHLRGTPQFAASKRGRGLGAWLLGWRGGGGGGGSSSDGDSGAGAHASSEAGMLVSKLPTTRQLEKWLDMEDWVVGKDTAADATAMRAVARRVGGSVQVRRGGALCVAVLPHQDGSHVVERVADGERDDGTKDPSRPAASVLSELSLEELIELSGGHVRECGPMNALCEHYGLYQIYTREYVQQLGEYLWKQHSQARTTTSQGPSGHDVILDVGAGDGLLAQLLNDYFASCATSSSSSKGRTTTSNLHATVSLPRSIRRGSLPIGRVHRKNPPRTRRGTASTTTALPGPDEEGAGGGAQGGPRVVATDDGSWRIRPRGPVERLSVDDALDAYAPSRSPSDQEKDADDETNTSRGRVTVLCSWMPMGVDWTALFRQHQVDEYLLIGECDDGQCGHNWETWGNPYFRPSEWNVADHGEEEGEEGYEGSSRRRSVGEPSAGSGRLPDGQVPCPPPPYELDGYERHDLDLLAPYQFSRYDSRVSKSGRTVSFRLRRP